MAAAYVSADTVDDSMEEQEEGFKGFGQATRLITCANYGNHHCTYVLALLGST